MSTQCTTPRKRQRRISNNKVRQARLKPSSSGRESQLLPFCHLKDSASSRLRTSSLVPAELVAFEARERCTATRRGRGPMTSQVAFCRLDRGTSSPHQELLASRTACLCVESQDSCTSVREPHFSTPDR